MKLIIDIDDEQVLFDIKNRGLESETETDKVIINALYDGIPLDDVKAEIKSWYWQVEKQALAKDPCVVDAMVDLFIRTIDNIGKAESEEE